MDLLERFKYAIGRQLHSSDDRIHSKYAQKVKDRIFFSHERKAKLMNLKLDGPTCNTIWSCHFERDESGVLKKTIKCTEICEKLQCIIGNDKIVILFSWLKTLKAFESANYETVKITARNNLYQDRIDKIFKIFKLFK